MWWNFVGRTHDEMASGTTEWNARSDRFGETRSSDGADSGTTHAVAGGGAQGAASGADS